MTDGKTYTAYLCSRVPNNQCELCSYFSPDVDSSTGRAKWMGHAAYANCPSCGRAVIRLFIEEGNNPPERVPDDYITKAHKAPKDIAKDEKILNPTHPREGYDGLTYWNAYKVPDSLAGKVDRAEKPEFTKRPIRDEKEPDFTGGKTVKRKLNIG